MRKAISTVALAADTPSEGAGEGSSISELRSQLEAERPGEWMHEVRFTLAQSLLGGGDHAGAMEELLRIIRRDKTWNDHQAKELLYRIFDSLGADHELTIKGRRKLANIVLM